MLQTAFQALRTSAIIRGEALGSSFLSRLAHDRQGTVGMIFAAMIIPVTAAIGMAVDLGKAIKVKTELQLTLDAAALAAGRELQTTGDVAGADAYVRNYFARTLPAGVDAEITRLEVDESSSAVHAAAIATVDTAFLSIIGTRSIEIAVSTAADIAQGSSGRNLEVAMMLDITGSMGGQKIADLKLAAKDLVQSLLPGSESADHTRIAVVPFSETVRPGNDVLARVIGSPPATRSVRGSDGRLRSYALTACVSERLGAEAFTDAAPATGRYVGPVYTSSGSCLPSSAVLPLSNDKEAIETKIDGLAASGWTAGQIGTAWAWYAISPEWADIWPMGSEPAPYGGDVTKVAVLMTDGEYNTDYRQGVQTRTVGGSPDNGASDDQAREMCEAMKAAGVTVYTIGFQLTDANAIETMSACASGDSYAFLADDGSELRQAFRDIAFRLADLKLTR
ncbi:MAG: VWA domain-containing protein [Hyphomicrobiaceae bacterium]